MDLVTPPPSPEILPPPPPPTQEPVFHMDLADALVAEGILDEDEEEEDDHWSNLDYEGKFTL